jgi:excisionase family DNA binding protein
MSEELLQELREIKQMLAFNKAVWNIDDLCGYTGISKEYAYHLTSQGKLEFYRPFGKLIFFDSEKVIVKYNRSL